MTILDKIKNSPLLELARDPRMRDILTKREFRLGEEELCREIIDQAKGEELQELSLSIGEGFLELSGKVRKHPIPFAIPFLARFSLHSIEFSPRDRGVRLRLDEMKPIESDSLTKKLVARIPFLSFDDGLITVHLARIPRLAGLLGCRVGEMRPFDHIVLKELEFRPGEVFGRIGVIL